MLISVGVLGFVSSLDPMRPMVFVMLLRTERARLNAIGFLVGWAIATAALFALGLVLFSHGDSGRAGSADKIWLSRAEVIAAVVLLVVALRRWHRREEPRTHRGAPAPVRRQLDRLTPRRSGFLGVLIQPRTVTIAAAVIVARDRSGLASAGFGLLVFALFSTGAILGLFTYFVRRPDRATSRLSDLTDRIGAAEPVLLPIGCALAGAYLLFDGIRGLGTG